MVLSHQDQQVTMPPTTPYAGKFNSNPYTNHSNNNQDLQGANLQDLHHHSIKHHHTYSPLEASYGEMCYHDNSLVSGSLEALIQHLVPTVDYYPDVSPMVQSSVCPSLPSTCLIPLSNSSLL